MDSKTYEHGAALSDCTAVLDENDQRAVEAFWDQVIRDAWEPPMQTFPRAVPLPEDERRARRQTRRAMARVAAAGRLAAVVQLRPAVGLAEFGVCRYCVHLDEAALIDGLPAGYGDLPRPATCTDPAISADKNVECQPGGSLRQDVATGLALTHGTTHTGGHMTTGETAMVDRLDRSRDERRDGGMAGAA